MSSPTDNDFHHIGHRTSFRMRLVTAPKAACLHNSVAAARGFTGLKDEYRWLRMDRNSTQTLGRACRIGDAMRVRRVAREAL